MKVYAVSLGCDKNRVDTETMLGLLVQEGYLLTPVKQEADVCLINTCGFIASAKEEAVSVILDAARLKDDGRCTVLVVAGCLAQRYPDELMAEIPEIDVLVGTGQVGEIAAAVKRALKGERHMAVGPPGYLAPRRAPRLLTTVEHTAYLKIAEGCSNCCSYCVIPRLRGRYRSKDPDAVFEEALSLVAGGVRELILVAQDTTRYGTDLNDGSTLAGLLARLAGIEAVKWLRVLYCYPTGITPELIETVAREPKVCRYLDIPMQHASDAVLRAMGRPTSRKDLVDLVARLRGSISGITLRSTFMVGFPGETEDDFLALLDFLREVRLDRAGFFAYSAEEGTAAAGLPRQVPEEVKMERLKRAFALQTGIMREHNREKVGCELTVLVEGRRGPFHWGRSEGDAPGADGRVFFGGARWAEPGEFVNVRVEKSLGYDLVGRITTV
ncbi:30S ribosomal protein S12 methylthiotransferase RimO [Desulforudis sp. 1190]|uniref:30S ribosomal protein S12 methylthiotransferase RimO n=1 Tax=Desulforudis sp. 1190 TaxID=3416136 RepID=UPI003CF29336